MPLLDPPSSPPLDPLKIPLDLIDQALARLYTLDVPAEDRSAITDLLTRAGVIVDHFRTTSLRPVHCVARGGPFDGETLRFARRDARYWMGIQNGMQGVCSEIPLSEPAVFQDGTEFDGYYVPHPEEPFCEWYPLVLSQPSLVV